MSRRHAAADVRVARRGFGDHDRAGGKLEEGLRAGMSADGFHGYDELIAELRRLCAERRTGTLFIATADNEGGQIALRDGLVVGARFRRKTGMEAAHGLRKITRARFSFTRDFVDAPDPTLSSSSVLSVLTDVDRAPQGLAADHDAIRGILTAALTSYLGPMAAMIVRDQLREAERTGRSVAEVVDVLATGIEERVAAAAFKATVSAALAAHALRRR